MARGGRDQRIGQEIQRLLPDLIRNEVRDPRVTGLITVTTVEVSHDLAHAKVFVTVLGEDAAVAGTLDALNHCSAFLRSALSQRMRLRIVPALKFVYDESVERGARLTRLIQSAVGSNPAGTDEPERPDS
jgi:ribosome-binding factor A